MPHQIQHQSQMLFDFGDNLSYKPGWQMSLQLNHNRHNTSKEKDELGVHHSHHHISKDMDEHWTWCPPQYSPHFKRKVTRPLLKTRMILISWCMEGNDQSKPVCIWNRDIRIVLTTTQAAIIQTKARTNHTNIRKQRSYKFYTDARIANRRTYASKAHQERWVSHKFCKEQHRLSKWSSPLCPDERSHIWPSSFQLDILGTPHILPPFLHVPLLLLSGPRR